MTEPLLKVRGVQTFYGKIQALKGIDMDVNAGEIVTLIGSNGAGKSTLMMTICGTPRARAGSIHFDGKDITKTPVHKIAQLGISQSPEGRRIFPRMTVLENLQMGATVSDPKFFDEDIARAFKMFPILEKRQAQRGGTLSGGEQQMLAIARALMSRPRLLLLDEPSLGLAPLIVKQIFEAIKELNRTEGLTVFLVEQNAFHALKLAHRGYVMVNGRITMSGTGKELLSRPEVRAAYLEGGHRAMSLFVEDNLWIFLIMTVFFGGGAAFLAGRGLAIKWRSVWMAVLAMIPLTLGLRFLHFALFDASLTSLHYLITDFIILLALCLLGYRMTIAQKMVRQYPWLYQAAGPLGWKSKD